MKINKKRKGFSMVELLFVMTVVAAIAAIAIPNLENSEKAAAMTAMKSDLHNAYLIYQQEQVLNLE